VSGKRAFGTSLPGIDLSRLDGALIVIEGPDSSGRSTQIALLGNWLEQQGYSVAQVGLRRSQLVGPEIEVAKQGNVLSPRTTALFYATDFYDQLENRIVPALHAGSIVLADRYIFTLIARAAIRGVDHEWLEALYSKALIPDATYFLSVAAPVLVERTFASRAELDYWESGMDLGLSRDWFESFLAYQRRMRAEYRRLQQRYGLEVVRASGSIKTVQHELRARVGGVLDRVIGVAPHREGETHGGDRPAGGDQGAGEQRNG
jgi:dTMP kinase